MTLDLFRLFEMFDEMTLDLELARAIDVAHYLVPNGRFKPGPRRTILASRSGVRALRKKTVDAAKYSTLVLPRGGGDVFVMGFRVIARGGRT